MFMHMHVQVCKSTLHSEVPLRIAFYHEQLTSKALRYGTS